MIDDIQLFEDGARGRYELSLDGGPAAVLTFKRLTPETIVIDHTGVPEVYRGRGVALLLMTRAVEDARRNGLKIIPECSYAAVQFKRHADWADILAT